MKRHIQVASFFFLFSSPPLFLVPFFIVNWQSEGYTHTQGTIFLLVGVSALIAPEKGSEFTKDKPLKVGVWVGGRASERERERERLTHSLTRSVSQSLSQSGGSYIHPFSLLGKSRLTVITLKLRWVKEWLVRWCLLLAPLLSSSLFSIVCWLIWDTFQSKWQMNRRMN